MLERKKRRKERERRSGRKGHRKDLGDRTISKKTVNKLLKFKEVRNPFVREERKGEEGGGRPILRERPLLC